MDVIATPPTMFFTNCIASRLMIIEKCNVCEKGLHDAIG